MIIGTSHISISTFNIQKDIEKFKKNGFSLTFLDEHVENNVEKKHYLNKYTAFHSIAVLSGRSGIDIELVEHQKENSDTKNRNIDISFGDGIVKQVEYNVKNLGQSVDFWQNFLGFTSVESGTQYSMLEKKSVFPKWNCRVRLTNTDIDFSEPKLDQKGVTSFAFLTTNLANAMEIFRNKYDLFCTEIFQLKVNGKGLGIAMLSGPSKEIIELIQVKK